MKKTWKRLVAVILATGIGFGSVPVTGISAFADEEADIQQTQNEGTEAQQTQAEETDSATESVPGAAVSLPEEATESDESLVAAANTDLSSFLGKSYDDVKSSLQKINNETTGKLYNKETKQIDSQEALVGFYEGFAYKVCVGSNYTGKIFGFGGGDSLSGLQTYLANNGYEKSWEDNGAEGSKFYGYTKKDDPNTFVTVHGSSSSDEIIQITVEGKFSTDGTELAKWWPESTNNSDEKKETTSYSPQIKNRNGTEKVKAKGYYHIIDECPILSSEKEAESFLCFVFNQPAKKLKKIESSNEYIKLLSGNFDGSDKDKYITAVALLANIEANIGNYSTEYEKRKDELSESLISYLKKNMPSSELQSAYDDTVASVQNAIIQTMYVNEDWIDGGIIDTIKFVQDTNGKVNIKNFVEKLTAAINGVNYIKSTEFAGRYQYFEEYLKNRPLWRYEPEVLRTIMEPIKLTQKDKSYMSGIIKVIRPGKVSWIECTSLIEKWAEYTYQLQVWLTSAKSEICKTEKKNGNKEVINSILESDNVFSSSTTTAMKNDNRNNSVQKTAPTYPSVVGFTDIPSNAYYKNSVIWAYNKKIVTGTSKTTFSPNAPCTRAQMATFLYRMSGSPKVSGTMPFTDVKNDYSYNAILWATQNGITSGKTKTTFDPKAPCTRGQMAIFLYRMKGSPKVSRSSGFSDVKGTESIAVTWAKQSGVTKGTSASKYEPGKACTRGQMVEFLYRYNSIKPTTNTTASSNKSTNMKAAGTSATSNSSTSSSSTSSGSYWEFGTTIVDLETAKTLQNGNSNIIISPLS